MATQERNAASRNQSHENSPSSQLPPISTNTINLRKSNEPENRKSPYTMRKESFISPLKHSIFVAKADRKQVDQDINILINRVQKLAMQHNHFENALKQSNKKALEIYKTQQTVYHEQASIVIIPKQRQREEIQRLEQIQKISIYQQIEDTRQMKELLKEQLERQKRNEELDQEDKRRRQESVQEFEKNLQKKTFMAAEEQKLRVVEDTITSLEREQAITKAQVDQLQLWKFMEMDLIQKLNKDQTQIQKSHRFLEDSQQMPLNQFQKVYQPEKIQEVPLLQKKPKRMMLNKSHNNSILQLGENDNNLSMQEQHRTTLHITEPNQ